jgi:hypothetical protein
MPIDDYARALELIGIASQHALGGSPDAARTVLAAAFKDGQLQRNDRREGRFHYLAVVALTDALEGKHVAAATALTGLLRDLRLIPPRARPDVLARCVQAMMELPHNKDIGRLLGNAKTDYQRRNYVNAFEKIRQAKGMRTRNRTLTPQNVDMAIETTATAAMTHLMETNSTTKVMEVTRQLRSRGLIEME